LEVHFVMAKYSYEEKLKAVKDVLENGMSLRDVAKNLGTHHEHVRRWVKRYELHGPDGLMMKKGIYTGDFKRNVVEFMHEKHLSISEVATIFGIPSDGTVSKWERIYYEEGPEALYRENRGRVKTMNADKPKKPKLSKQTEEDLIAEVQRLRMENAYLKKLMALVQEREKSDKKTK